MDPHAKEDIQKFQEKLEKIDKELDKQNKLVLATNVDFYAIKDEFTQLNDKRKAYQEAFTCMNDQMKSKKQQGGEKQSWKIKKFFFSQKSVDSTQQIEGGGFQLVSSS